MTENGKPGIGKDIYYMADHQEYMRKLRSVSKEDLYELQLEMKRLIISSTENDPVLMLFGIFNQLNALKAGFSIPIHGEWHHSLIPGVLLSALKNNGYEISEKDVEEGIMRGGQAKVSCGFTGVCGGVNAFGIVIAVVKKMTPLHTDERKELMQQAAVVLHKIAEIRGRCCKRSSYIALDETIKYLAGMKHPLPRTNISCSFSMDNKTCARERCPYYETK